MAARAQLVEEARTWLGTPFHHQGRLKGVGVDCIGLLVGVPRAFGLEITDCTSYSTEPDGITLINEIARRLDRIDPVLARAGDVLLFWMDPDYVSHEKRFPRHVGLVSDHGLIHTYQTVGKVVEHGLSKAWRDHIHSAWAYRGLA